MRRIPISRRSHVTGFQPLHLASVEHESALERDFVTRVRFTDPAARITSQPITLVFGDGIRSRRYTPDFLVQWSTGLCDLVEVKYRVDLKENWERLRPAFVEARTWAREHQGRFRIATERGIRDALLENAKRLLPLRDVPLDADVAREIFAGVRSLSTATFAQIVARTPGERVKILGAVWRMIARGELRVDLGAPIGWQSHLSVP